MMFSMPRFFVLIIFLTYFGCDMKAQDSPPGQTEHTLKISPTSEIKYLLYLPEGYTADTSQAWPLMLFLHGAGERGDNLDLVKRHGPPKLVANGQDFPFILVSPQCRQGNYWSAPALQALLVSIEQQYAIDPSRIYLTGISMGGYATWDLAIRMPDKFAAIAPVCGGGNAAKACNIKEVPVWAFHGAKDDLVLPGETIKMVQALRGCNGDVKFTLYPEADHDSWTVTYNNPEIFEWFMGHQNEKK